MDIARFDRRGYRTVSAEDGYAEWAATYEETVLDLMDLRLFERLASVDWSQVQQVADLACGTGRIGQWLADRGVPIIDGVDLTTAMLDRAQTRGVYRRLAQGDVAVTPFQSASYDLVTAVLVDEHLPDLRPLYREAARLIRPGRSFVLVAYHPFFLLNGIPTHFDTATGEPVAIRCYVHLVSDHVRAASESDLQLVEMHEGLVDDDWLARKPKWGHYQHLPISFALVWRKGALPP